MRNIKGSLFVVIVIAILLCLLSAGLAVNAQARRPQSAFVPAAPQQPLYSEYKAIRLGMSADDVHTKLGTPALKSNDQDFYIFSETETAQFGYQNHKVTSISVDYLRGVGAPDYKSVVGGELATTSSGSLYRMVRYENLGFWVSYNRSTGPVPTVTITIQKIMG